MKQIQRHTIGYAFVVFTAMLWMQSCAPAEDEHTGHEFMPDMVHSLAYEANVYSDYYWNTWNEESSVKKRKLAEPRLPVEGTVPRGYAGMHYATTPSEASDLKRHMNGEATKQGISVPWNGHVPFHFEDTEEERQRAMEEITMNPYPITEEGLKKGEKLYTIYCGICHGSGAAGDGYLLRADGGKYPAQPAILTTEEFVNASAGRYYFALMYGKNLMGEFADKLNYEERWQVIHYVRSLQADEVGATYNSEENTLNDGAIPATKWDKQVAEQIMERESELGGHEPMDTIQ